MNNQRKQGKPRKLDQKKVLDLHARGFSAPEIAQQQGVAHSTVWRFLERMRPEIKAVAAFRQNRADVLARIQAKSLDAQERIIETLDDGLLATLTPSQKSAMLIALNAQSGTLFDKERLERGQSSQNVAILTAMLEGAHNKLYTKAVIPPIEAERVNMNADGETQSK